MSNNSPKKESTFCTWEKVRSIRKGSDELQVFFQCINSRCFARTSIVIPVDESDLIVPVSHLKTECPHRLSVTGMKG